MPRIAGLVLALATVISAHGQSAELFQDSMSRLPLVHRDDMDHNGKRVYDLIASINRTGRFSGPAAISLYTPSAAEPIHLLNEALRKTGVLGPRFTELAVLTAAREINQAYEWTGHEPAAVRAGVEPETIDTIRYNKPLDGLGEKEGTIIRLGRQLFRERKADPALNAKAEALFGKQGRAELAVLMGVYAMVGMMLHAVDQQLGADRKSALPVIDGVGPKAGIAGQFTAAAPDFDLAAFTPAIAEQVHALDESLRTNAVLGTRLTELTGLVAAREINHRFGWMAHVDKATRAGVDDRLIDVVKSDRPLAGLDEKDAAVIRFGRELVRSNAIDSATFAQAVKLFGRPGTVEIATIIGYCYLECLMQDLIGAL